VPPQGALTRDAIALVIGVVARLVFAGRVHQWMVGVNPLA
jgi:hypothetical protein